MNLSDDVDLEEFILSKDELSGADVKVGLAVIWLVIWLASSLVSLVMIVYVRSIYGKSLTLTHMHTYIHTYIPAAHASRPSARKQACWDFVSAE